jgi:hypothetical protein
MALLVPPVDKKKMEIGQNVLKVQLGNNQQDLLQDKKKAPRHSA